MGRLPRAATAALSDNDGGRTVFPA